MEDAKILELFKQRDEKGISELSAKYGGYCRSVAYGILKNNENTEECLNDTWLRVWHRIPPAEPVSLKAYVGKISRNLALDRFDKETAKKRGGFETTLAFDELSECIGENDVVSELYESQIAEIINAFLGEQPQEKRKLFVRRYWYMTPIAKLAAEFGMSESNVKTTLSRLRKALKEKLEQEGVKI